jgi:hypothetical protein
MSLITVLNKFFKTHKVPEQGVQEYDFIKFCQNQSIDWADINTTPDDFKNLLFIEDRSPNEILTIS